MGAHCDDATGHAPTAPQPDSGLPPRAEAAVHVWRSDAVEHAFAELVAVVAELPRMLHQPARSGVIHWNPPLHPLLEGQHQGTGQPLELPHGVLDRAIGLRLISRGQLLRSLNPQALGRCPSQAQQRRLIIGLEQDPTM
eukprot:5051352-Alexandrium_andersonii.AAC.1